MGAAVLAASSACCQTFPDKPIRMVTELAAGTGGDVLLRRLLPHLFVQPVIVDNRAGGGGTIGAETAVRANPDGYTLALVSTSYATNPSLHKLSYDAVKDIQAIILIGETGYVVALHPGVPLKSVKEVVAYNKANPGKLNYGSTGTGGATHLATELFDLMAGTKMTHVPYKGAGPAIQDTLAGHIPMTIQDLAASGPSISGGKLTPLAVTSTVRWPRLPDVPTFEEAGYKINLVGWNGILAPAGTPKEIVDRVSAEAKKALADPAMRDKLAEQGIVAVGGTPEEFRAFVAEEISRWSKVITDAGIKME